MHMDHFCLAFNGKKSKFEVIFPINYVFYASAYCSTHSNVTNMIDFSFNCALPCDENEGSMKRIGCKTKAARHVEDGSK